MKRIRVKSVAYQTILTGLAVFFLYLLTWSDIGVVRYYSLHKQVATKEAELVLLHRDVKKIQTAIANWQSDPFYLEKMAREELGMGYPDEVVYLYQS